MKLVVILSGAALLLAAATRLQAQAVPTTPVKFNTKAVGSVTGTTGASISPPATKSVIRQVTYLTLSPLRQWNSTDGKSLMGKLIAWEESVSTTQESAPPPALTRPVTTKPTVLKDRKARLLIDNKAFEVPLERLAAEEQKFILGVKAAVATKR